MTAQSPYLTSIRQQCSTINDTAFDLFELARAARLLGNSKLGETLEFHADRLQATSLEVEKAVRKEIHDQYAETVGQVGKTLSLLVDNIKDKEDQT